MKKRHRAEEVVVKVREAETDLANGVPVDEVCRKLDVSPATLTRWRHQYGGLSTPEAKRIRELEKENDRLKKAVADLTLDKTVLKETIKHLGKR